MKYYISFFLLTILSSISFAQTKEQAMIALRAEEHTKVEIDEHMVTFRDHTGEINNIQNFEYLALELAEALYLQMSDHVYNPYFNAIFSEGYSYRNIIECKGGLELILNASPTEIVVSITDANNIELAKESFSL
ncbi:hypothetical protein [Flammeovirga sp. SubArs3]|uniref:hypothetical protein n=1 Tax=Flammeovirga sp. SubArs3 TaxID=2995316 RepID=UPI00248C5497|nr:hypothetical protein [Flammeovirga sp. SubArs3]